MDTRIFWGKTDRHIRWHPAVFHMIDVGMVSDALLRILPINLNKKLTKNGVINNNQLCFMSALHDIGKITPGFQWKVEQLVNNLKTQGYSCKFYHRNKPSNLHNVSTIKILSEIGDKGFSSAIGGHHGSFISANDKLNCNIGDNVWINAQKEVYNTIKDVFNPGQFNTPNDNEWSILFAAFVSISDWIGSNEKYFGFDNVSTIGDYIKKSNTLALNAVNDIWKKSNYICSFLTFTESFNKTAYSWQNQIMELVKQQQKPFLLLIESPTGGGKSEAAMLAANIAIQKFGYHGIYFALPTQATAAQMYDRFGKFITRSINASVEYHLLHSMSYLNKVYIDNNGNKDSWFRNRKQGILSPYVVGTIDQILMSVLKIKHNFVKLFGLTNKVIIIDEVHSYDVYTETVLLTLLEWLSSLGSTVILLSATLTNEKRKELIKAYSGNSSIQFGSYPRVTCASCDAIDVINIKHHTNKLVHIEELNEDCLLKDLSEKLSKDNCIAIVCNTVGRAQNLYREVCKYIPQTIDKYLLHSRYLAEEKEIKSKTIINKFGKDGERPKRAILIGTQIIEQSLDIDFDYMISEVAPMDLILQRMGRLWRHDRKRNLPRAEFKFIKPPEQEDFGNSEIIYSKFVLINTYNLLKTKNEINAVTDSEDLIEKTYTNFNKEFSKWLEKQYGPKILATEYSIPRPCADDLLSDMAEAYDENEFPMTRITHLSAHLIIVDVANKVDLTKTPSQVEITELLKRSVDIAIYPWCEYFNAMSCPEGWQECLLKYFRLLYLNGSELLDMNLQPIVVGDKTLRYTDEYGLESC